ncbi:MAG: response regulator transcription factor [Acidobacteriota bacterium]
MRILIVEDERAFARTLARALEEEGFAVDLAGDGEEGLFLATEVPYAAIVLDLMLPKRDGWSVLDTLRRGGRQTPVLVLTTRDAVDDRVRGLNLGADDYLTKPFALAELVARLRALIRRAEGDATPAVVLGHVRVDTAARRVDLSGVPVALTAREYAILELLVLRRGRLVTRSEIHDHIYGEAADVLSNTIDVHVASPRRKLGREMIETRRGLGYLIDA